MPIDIIDPQFQTILFFCIFSLFIFLSIRKDISAHEMNISHTEELKGIAMLMVVFSHIGYFLFSDHKFLYPFSMSAGVGVNIFLLLSGFGLTKSALKSSKPLSHFYKKRLLNLFLPMWMTLLTFIILDKFILNITYDCLTIIKSIFGYFPSADVYTNINSPLWYFTFILFYYLIFPVVFNKKYAFISILSIIAIGVILTYLPLPVSEPVLKLYKLHIVSFPLGMLFCYIFEKQPVLKIKYYLSRLDLPVVIKYLGTYLFFLSVFILFAYTTVNSGVGEKTSIEQSISVISTLLVLSIFVFKTYQSSFLVIIGRYSYEIYLLHWPIAYRYGHFIYNIFPPFLGITVYLIFVILLSILLNKFTSFIINYRRQ